MPIEYRIRQSEPVASPHVVLNVWLEPTCNGGVRLCGNDGTTTQTIALLTRERRLARICLANDLGLRLDSTGRIALEE